MLSNQELIDILLEARTKINQGWCQGAYARDKEGRIVSTRDPSACQWCVLGVFFTMDRSWHEASQALIKTINKMHNLNISSVNLQDWNDTLKSQEELLAVFDQTIGELKAGCN